jgi:arylformamidase
MTGKFIDISLPVYPGMVVWEDDSPVEIGFDMAIAEGDEANVSYMRMGVHTGTHVDAPLHFIDGGKGMDEMDLSLMMGEVYVFETDAKVVTAEVLEGGNIPEIRRLLIKSGNGELYKTGVFEPDFCALDESGADWILARGIGLVGIDYLSVEVYGNKDRGEPVHHKLLGREVILLEGLVLEGVSPGFYDLMALPLRLVGTEGAPVRALLFPRES